MGSLDHDQIAEEAFSKPPADRKLVPHGRPANSASEGSDTRSMTPAKTTLSGAARTFRPRMPVAAGEHNILDIKVTKRVLQVGQQCDENISFIPWKLVKVFPQMYGPQDTRDEVGTAACPSVTCSTSNATSRLLPTFLRIFYIIEFGTCKLF